MLLGLCRHSGSEIGLVTGVNVLVVLDGSRLVDGSLSPRVELPQAVAERRVPIELDAALPRHRVPVVPKFFQGSPYVLGSQA
jgi:hypothetical protein